MDTCPVLIPGLWSLTFCALLCEVSSVFGYRDAGILGFNSALIGLALGKFYQLNTALWIMAPVAGGRYPCARPLAPRPVPPRPVHRVLLALGPIASSAGLNKIHLGAFPVEATSYFPETIASMRSILFSPVMLAGGLFLLGVLVSNWRHVIVTAGRTDCRRPRHARPHRGRSDRQWGYVRFNAVLAALAVFILVAEDPRLAALGALVATWIFSFINLNPVFPRSRRVSCSACGRSCCCAGSTPASSASPLGPRLRLRPPAESACQGKAPC